MLVFSKETEELLAGIAGCLTRLGALPKQLVWDRQAGIHGHAGRPSESFAAFCGQLKVEWRFCEPADPQAKGAVERLPGYAETNFEPGRRFADGSSDTVDGGAGSDVCQSDGLLVLFNRDVLTGCNL